MSVCTCLQPASSAAGTQASAQSQHTTAGIARPAWQPRIDRCQTAYQRRDCPIMPTRVFCSPQYSRATSMPIQASQRQHSSFQAGNFMGLMGQVLQQMAATMPQGAALTVEGIKYHPAGSAVPLLDSINLQLPANKLGLIFGRSGAGKTTLLQLLAGLTSATSGTIALGPAPLTPRELAMRCGLVFQFPERYFLGGSLQEELTFGWPISEYERQAYVVQTRRVLTAVGLNSFPLDTPLQHLSGGYKRRAALAVQLIRRPGVLLLDEPLAGLDWRARAELADTLKRLKSECTILVVSHDLRELTPLVDHAWQMQPGGTLETAAWPPVAPALA